VLCDNGQEAKLSLG